MLFNSYEFIFIFLPICLLSVVIFEQVGRNYSILVLLLFSLVFYSYYNPEYIFLISFSIILNYFLSRNFVTRTKLVLGVLVNVGLLFYYKYTNFFLDNLFFAFNYEFKSEPIVLPLAISFFTFQQIAYLVDSYKNRNNHSFVKYSTFVCFFPQLIAGPIVHYSEVSKQLEKICISYENFSKGMYYFSIGLFKKIVIADTFSITVDKGFANPDSLDFLSSWIVSLSYSFQLYFDFSGYCDMAIGIALFFSIRLPINFNSPYKSTSIQEFWRRWHITLGLFLRNYIYIPLGGSKNGALRTSVNLLVTFFIAGVWHGAGWNFFIWGVLHGLAMVINRIWIASNLKLNQFVSWVITFGFVNFCWVVFRSDNVDIAISIISKMISPTFLNMSSLYPYRWEIVSVLVGFGMVLFCKNLYELKMSPNWKFLCITAISFVLSISLLDKESAFLYFNF